MKDSQKEQFTKLKNALISLKRVKNYGGKNYRYVWQYIIVTYKAIGKPIEEMVSWNDMDIKILEDMMDYANS